MNGKDNYKILLVDDEPAILKSMGMVLNSVDFPRITSLGSGAEAAEVLAREQFDLVLTDHEMPGIKGDKVAELALKANAHTAVMVFGAGLDRGMEKALRMIGVRGFIGKPFSVPLLIEEVEKVYTELAWELDARCHLKALTATAIEAWEANSYRPDKKFRALDLVIHLGRRLGFSLWQLEGLKMSFLAQDIGMLRVDHDLLRKASPLTSKELDGIRQHPMHSVEMARQFPCEFEHYEAIRAHHERLDGTGYPLGLKGNDIPLMAQLLSVVDSYVALDSDRPYRPALKKEEVFQVLSLSRNQIWNGGLVDLLHQQESLRQ